MKRLVNMPFFQRVFFQNQLKLGIIIKKQYGKWLHGSDMAKESLKQLSEKVKALKAMHGLFPKLAIVQVGSREDSKLYVKMKMKAAFNVGIETKHISLSSSTNQAELLKVINQLNLNSDVHGIIVQLPLDSVNPIDTTLVTDTVSPSKDVDGLSTINQGKVAIGDLASGFLPCTPVGCLELIKKSGVSIEGSHAVIIGRSKIVGTPVAELLKWHHATVTICHSKTKGLAEISATADILVVAAGRPKLIQGSWVKQGAVVIDCGINSILDLTKLSGSRIIGDVDSEEAIKRASWITPVPGGVGPMTVAMLLKNTVLATQRSLTISETAGIRNDRLFQ